MDLQLNRLDWVKMLIKQSSWNEPLPESIEVADIIDVYKEEKEKLRIYFEKLPCRISLMINLDLSKKMNYICFSVHFIDDYWKLKETIIGLKYTVGGDSLPEIIKNVFFDWGIVNKIYCTVLDGWSYDFVSSPNESEKNGLSGQGSLLPSGKSFFIRDFHCFFNFCVIGMKHDLLSCMRDICYSSMGYALDKKVRTGILKRDIGVEDLVKTALDLKERVEDPVRSALGRLTEEEWDLITTFYDEFKDETEDEILWYRYGTANMYFPWLCRRYMISREFMKLKSSKFLREDKLQSIRDGMNCWYGDNLVLAVAAVLDPRLKMDIVKHWYEKIYGDECETRLSKFKDYLTSVYNKYAEETKNSASGSKEKKSSFSYEMLDPSGKQRRFSHDHPTEFELDRYLGDAKFPFLGNILEWWQFNSQYLPTLARMARDFLSIKITIPKDGLKYCDLYSKTHEPHKDFDTDMVDEAFICSRDWLKS